jgi:hypothetical protein
MAKSIRSKWKRKCRAVKRVRYGQKELERLKKTLGIDESQSASKDVNMTEISEVANVTDGSAIKRVEAETTETNEMDTDNKRIFNTRTLRDQHGAYPVWLHPRKIMKKKKSKKGKKGKKGKH